MRGVVSVWRLGRPDGSTLKFRAREMPEYALDEVQFISDELPDLLRVVRTLGAGRAPCELWTEDEHGGFGWAPHASPPTGDARRVLALAERLSEEHLLVLCQSFAPARTVWHADQLEQALVEQQPKDEKIPQRQRRVLALVAMETALELEPGPLKDVAISLARTWRGNSDGLLLAARTVLDL